MHWIVLIISGLFEAVWAVALDRSEGFTKLWPTVTFLLALIVSMAGLAYALKELPLGLSYAIWVGIGAVATITFSIATGAETLSLLKAMFLIMIIGGVVGLKFVH